MRPHRRPLTDEEKISVTLIRGETFTLVRADGTEDFYRHEKDEPVTIDVVTSRRLGVITKCEPIVKG